MYSKQNMCILFNRKLKLCCAFRQSEVKGTKFDKKEPHLKKKENILLRNTFSAVLSADEEHNNRNKFRI